MSLPINAKAAQAVHWHELPNLQALQKAALQRILDAAARAIATRQAFHIVLSGGNTPRPIYQMLRLQKTDWSAWHVYFGDERAAPRDDKERNSQMAKETWLDHVPIPAPQVHVIPAEQGAAHAAAAYAEVLRHVGDFDLVLLGLGEDGHTASLFPGHDWGAAPESPDVLAVFNAPKPPPERVSLSARRLTQAQAVLFIVEGDAKAAAVAQWHAGSPLPASAIRPAAGVDVLVTAESLEPQIP
ncbi:MAG TPA: 6-phosphogluconolactonase [Alphaproteobacteria bacterium]|jgi:6-phosphogluconolactonase